MQLTFAIPPQGTLIPEKGTSVKLGDPLIQFHSSETKIYDIAMSLSVKPDAVFNSIAVVVGQQVSPGTILAEKKALIGKKQVQSDIEGVVDRIELETGNLIVRFGSKATDQTKKSWFEGTIHAIDTDKKTFDVHFKDGHEYPLSWANMDGGGELAQLDEKNFFTFGSDDVMEKAILLENPQVHIISKLDALDAGGCISTEAFPNSDVPCATLAKKKDFEELLHTKKKYCVFSASSLTAVVY
jgi:hypothetical protein